MSDSFISIKGPDCIPLLERCVKTINDILRIRARLDWDFVNKNRIRLGDKTGLFSTALESESWKQCYDRLKAAGKLESSDVLSGSYIIADGALDLCLIATKDGESVVNLSANDNANLLETDERFRLESDCSEDSKDRAVPKELYINGFTKQWKKK